MVNASVLGEIFTATLGNHGNDAVDNNLGRGESYIDNQQQPAAMDGVNVVTPVEQSPAVIAVILPETTKKSPVILRFVIVVVNPLLVKLMSF